MANQKFPLGEVMITQGIAALMESSKEVAMSVRISLRRHATGDWGDLCAEDKAANKEALLYGSRLFSAYKLKDGRKIWIITESDRSYTTVLLPEEY